MLAHKESLVVEVVVLPVSLLFAQEIFCYSTIFAGWHHQASKSWFCNYDYPKITLFSLNSESRGSPESHEDGVVYLGEDVKE